MSKAESQFTPFINTGLIETARRDDVLVVFPHTQRTGGKVLRDKVLAAGFGRERIYSASLGTGTKKWTQVKPADLEGFRVFTANFDYRDLDKRRPCVFVGQLRDPIYRAVSLYFYCQRRDGHKLQKLALRTGLEEFYRTASRTLPRYFRNVQCTRLCGKPDAYEAAKTIAKRYLGIGFMRDVAAFGNALGEIFDWTSIPVKRADPDENRYDPLISDGFRELVLQDNTEDQKLYKWAMSGIWPQLPEQGITGTTGLFSRLFR